MNPTSNTHEQKREPNDSAFTRRDILRDTLRIGLVMPMALLPGVLTAAVRPPDDRFQLYRIKAGDNPTGVFLKTWSLANDRLLWGACQKFMSVTNDNVVLIPRNCVKGLPWIVPRNLHNWYLVSGSLFNGIDFKYGSSNPLTSYGPLSFIGMPSRLPQIAYTVRAGDLKTGWDLDLLGLLDKYPGLAPDRATLRQIVDRAITQPGWMGIEDDLGYTSVLAMAPKNKPEWYNFEKEQILMSLRRWRAGNWWKSIGFLGRAVLAEYRRQHVSSPRTAISD
jgi:hypothetical protein